MLYVHAPGQTTTYQTDKATLKSGKSYELYVYRAPRLVGAAVCFVFVLASVAFLLYAVFSKIENLWIYATAAVAVTSFLTILSASLSFILNYERISLAGAYAHAFACQHGLLVIRNGRDQAEGWFASGFVLFIHNKEAHLYTSADFRRLDPQKTDGKGVRGKYRMAAALQRRSFIQTDSTDLRDYLRCVAIRNQSLLARKAGLAVRRG